MYSDIHKQGDQIGRIFALWAIVNFDIVSISHYFSVSIFFATFSTMTVANLVILTKYGLGYSLGDFF
jgi:hypothetical protein